MDIKSIKSILSQGENEKIEFKQSFDREAIETITAFSNSRGGVLLVGIKDDNVIVGVKIGQESVQNYINQVKNSTEPSLVIDMEQVAIEGKTILFIKADEFPISPSSPFPSKIHHKTPNISTF